MRRMLRLHAWVLLLAMSAGGLHAAVRPALGSGAHCGGAMLSPQEGHAPPRLDPRAGNASTVRAPHHFPGCHPGHCPDMAHCLTVGSLAVAPHAPAFGLAGPFTSDRPSPDDRPLSANPTPPIPPPQLAL